MGPGEIPFGENWIALVPEINRVGRGYRDQIGELVIERVAVEMINPLPA